MIVLVVGLLQFDSGKTSLALSLITEALDKGVDVGVCKPITAFSGWYQYSSVLRSIEIGKLVGEDIYKLHFRAKSEDPIEIESPVVFMHMPPDPERVDWQSAYYTAMSLNEQIIAIRVGKDHYYIPSNMNRLTNVLKTTSSNLIRSLDPSPKILEDVEEILLNSGDLANDYVKEIIRRHELTIIESYNDASAPTWSSLEADVVLLVAPSKVAVYDGDRYRKAVELYLKPPWLISSGEVVSLLKPIETIEIKPAVGVGEAWGLLDKLL